jgi:hypothetical protein
LDCSSFSREYGTIQHRRFLDSCLLGAAFGRNQNHQSRKKRKKAKKGDKWSLLAFSPLLRLFSFFSALLSSLLSVFLSERQEAAPLQCRGDGVGHRGREYAPRSVPPQAGTYPTSGPPARRLPRSRADSRRPLATRAKAGVHVLWVRRVCPSRRLGVWDGLSTLHGIASWTARGYKRHEVAGLPRRIVPLMGVV